MESIPQIGESSRASIEHLRGLLRIAQLPDSPDVEAFFEKAQAHLRAGHVRVSVVGQVKAGKSSLINVLAGMPGLLPTEVNPWTAVITNLHFGHPDKPRSGGEFQLFSEDEWQEMLEGNKETRALAEDLLPGFDSNILKQQVAEMQASAKHRLGELYRHLLGKTHKFSAITPEILERYVSAGHHARRKGDKVENAGRFSGITKSADVFLPAGPFAIPVTLSDTPGINDPFLVRDEITTGSFRDADIFVVAISVHQALGAADMALLKMLSRHKGKGLVIFVNRIDEMEELATGVPAILRALEERLSNELQGVDYTLVAGSAHWGDLAQNGSDLAVQAVVEAAKFKDYCKGLGIRGNTAARKKLATASGCVPLGQVLSELMENGPVRAKLAKVAGEAAVAMNLQKSILQERMHDDGVTLLDVGNVPAILDLETSRLEHRINALVALLEELDDAESDIRTRLLQNGDVVSRSITNTLEASLDRFANAEAMRLQFDYAAGGLEKWSLDTAELSERIEAQTVQSYQNGRMETDALIARFASGVGEKLARVFPEFTVGQLLENLPHDEILPGYKPKTTLIDIKLVNDRGWRFWKRAEMDEAQAVDAVMRVIRSEMLPGVDTCCEVASLAIAERTGEALARISQTKTAARGMISTAITGLKAELETLNEGVSEVAIARINSQRQARLSSSGAALARLEESLQILSELYLKHRPIPDDELGHAGQGTGGK